MVEAFNFHVTIYQFRTINDVKIKDVFFCENMEAVKLANGIMFNSSYSKVKKYLKKLS